MTESGPVVLRSTANPTVRHLIRLRENRYRRKSDRIIVDGWRETSQAMESGLTLCGVYVREEGADDLSGTDEEAQSRVVDRANAVSKKVFVSDAIMEKISFGQSPRGVVAEFERPDRGLDRLKLPKSAFVLVLDQIEKPGNVGAVFRCADAAGVDAILLSDCQDPFNPNAIRNSLGAIFRVPTATGTSESIAKYLAHGGFSVMGARVESSTPFWSVSWAGSVAVVLGSEAHGLGERWKTIPQYVDGKLTGDHISVPGVRIPMAGKVDSLNISVSAAVIAFEAVRQRGHAGSSC
ncbi:TrmH family RNA methyltransferase [Rubripirellula tenax]|nr:RNA methyltransferase [Rubripirellula tenax]